MAPIVCVFLVTLDEKIKDSSIRLESTNVRSMPAVMFSAVRGDAAAGRLFQSTSCREDCTKMKMKWRTGKQEWQGAERQVDSQYSKQNSSSKHN